MKLQQVAAVCLLALTLATACSAIGASRPENEVNPNSGQQAAENQTPTPADNRPLKKEAVQVKGLYMTGTVFNIPKYFNNLVDIVDRTELNAIVIDVKDDDGMLSFPMNIPLAQEIKAPLHKGMNAALNVNHLLAKNIYPIARIVTFKDPALAEAKPELAIRDKSGKVWRDKHGLSWVDPHNKKVWDYAIDVAKESAKLGFREIQFDYVRFPTDGKGVKDVVYPFANGKSMEDVIADFLEYAKKELEPYNVFVAADVFGLTTLTADDMGIGQKFEKVITKVDYICPMVYPSHYGPYNYTFKNPNAHPYEVVYNALKDAGKKAESVGSQTIIRPWLQAFSLGSPKYGAAEVKAQIKAVYDAGYSEWILWNAGNKYDESALLKG